MELISYCIVILIAAAALCQTESNTQNNVTSSTTSNFDSSDSDDTEIQDASNEDLDARLERCVLIRFNTISSWMILS